MAARRPTTNKGSAAGASNGADKTDASSNQGVRAAPSPAKTTGTWRPAPKTGKVAPTELAGVVNQAIEEPPCIDPVPEVCVSNFGTSSKFAPETAKAPAVEVSVPSTTSEPEVVLVSRPVEEEVIVESMTLETSKPKCDNNELEAELVTSDECSGSQRHVAEILNEIVGNLIEIPAVVAPRPSFSVLSENFLSLPAEAWAVIHGRFPRSTNKPAEVSSSPLVSPLSKVWNFFKRSNSSEEEANSQLEDAVDQPSQEVAESKPDETVCVDSMDRLPVADDASLEQGKKQKENHEEPVEVKPTTKHEQPCLVVNDTAQEQNQKQGTVEQETSASDGANKVEKPFDTADAIEVESTIAQTKSSFASTCEVTEDSPKSPLTVRVVCDATQVGDSVAVVGASDNLGSWDRKRAVVFRTSPAEWPTWTGHVEAVSAGAEYKFFIVNSNGDEHWEPIEGNRRWPSGDFGDDVMTFGVN